MSGKAMMKITRGYKTELDPVVFPTFTSPKLPSERPNGPGGSGMV